MTPRPDSVVRWLQRLAITALFGLVVLGAAWELWLAPTGSGTLAIKVLPLLPCVPGVLRHRMYTYRWLSLLVWLYAAEGAVRAASDTGLSRVLAGCEVALALLLFVACALYVRRRLRNASTMAVA